jgi:hypothetical protein
VQTDFNIDEYHTMVEKSKRDLAESSSGVITKAGYQL